MKRVELRDVVVSFGKVKALRGVTCGLGASEILLLAGPNGAGKSTFIRVLLGLVRPNSGGLWVDGAARQVDHAFKSNIAYLPEAVAFSENLSGRQVLRFFARARGLAKKRVEAVLERVGLKHAAGRAVRGYSRGMRQRLGIGVAILGEPSLLVLDEPTGGLDQEGLSVLWSVFDEWRTAGRMILLSSHDLTLLERRVDRICLLADGVALADASPDHLRQDAGLPVQVSFTLDPSTNAAPLVAAVRAEETMTLASSQPGVLRVGVPPADLLTLMNLRGEHSEIVTGIRVEEPGLDAVYDLLLQRYS